MNTMNLVETLNWEAQKKSISISVNGSNKVVPNFTAIVRDDSHETLSIVKKKYNLLSNKDFMTLVHDICEISRFELKGFQSIQGGEIILGYLKNGDPNFKIGNLKAEDYLVFGNSFTRKTSLFVGTSTKILSCQNQFGQIHQNIKIPHFSTMEKRIQEMKTFFINYFQTKQDMLNALNGFQNIKISPEIIEEAITYILDLEKFDKLDDAPKQRQSKIIDLRESITSEMMKIGENGWGLFNGITHFTTHKISGKRSSNETIGNLFGVKNTFNQKGFSFISNLVLETTN